MALGFYQRCSRILSFFFLSVSSPTLSPLVEATLRDVRDLILQMIDPSTVHRAGGEHELDVGHSDIDSLLNLVHSPLGSIESNIWGVRLQSRVLGAT